MGALVLLIIVGGFTFGILGAPNHPSPASQTQTTTEVPATAEQGRSSTTTSLAPIEQPSQAWKTYVNNAYQYSIMYPPDWTFDASAATDTVFDSPDPVGITVTVAVYENRSGLTEQEWAHRAWGNQPLPGATTTIIGGAPAYEATTWGGDHTLLFNYAQHDGKMYNIEFDNYDLGLGSDLQSQYQAVFQKMVNTFQFL